MVGIQPTASPFTNMFNDRLGIVDSGIGSDDNNRPAVPPAAFSFALSKDTTVRILSGAGLGGSSPRLRFGTSNPPSAAAASPSMPQATAWG
jgi:hypothetical protein